MWEKLYCKQSAELIIYQREDKQKEEQLVMLRKNTTSLQLELRRQYKIFTAKKVEKKKMICELNNKQKTINELQTNITIHNAEAIKLTQQLQQQSVELEKLQIRSQSQMDEMKIIIKKMQKMEEKKCTVEIKLSKLNDQIKHQYEEISNKNQVTETLRDEIKNYTVEENETKRMAITQFNVDNKISKSTDRKEIKQLLVLTQRLLAIFICKTFLLEKKLISE